MQIVLSWGSPRLQSFTQRRDQHFVSANTSRPDQTLGRIDEVASFWIMTFVVLFSKVRVSEL
jgi:hypothetical protein